MGEAQNTAAHAALYQLLATTTVRSEVIMPAGEPSSFNGDRRKLPCSVIQLSTEVAGTPESNSIESLRQSLRQALRRSKKPEYSRRRGKKKANTQAQPVLQERKVKKKAIKSTGATAPCGNANRIPLTKCRLSPIDQIMDMAEDPLATLRAIQKKLGELDSNASFFRIMKSRSFG